MNDAEYTFYLNIWDDFTEKEAIDFIKDIVEVHHFCDIKTYLEYCSCENLYGNDKYDTDIPSFTTEELIKNNKELWLFKYKNKIYTEESKVFIPQNTWQFIKESPELFNKLKEKYPFDYDTYRKDLEKKATELLLTFDDHTLENFLVNETIN